ncbi:hypothetical protein SBDP1_200006 [Syntrophobacter sp. SbD1]|nr:hypothetical protein SBDP1_200006 [Syntrophobacter sp. SbD1]
MNYMLGAIAKDCGLDGGEIQLKDLPGYGGTMKVDEVGKLFSGLKSNWGKPPVPGAENVDHDLAIMNARHSETGRHATHRCIIAQPVHWFE